MTPKKTKVLHIRVTEEEKKAFEAAAGDKPVTEWIRDVLGAKLEHAPRALPCRWVRWTEVFPDGERWSDQVASDTVGPLSRRGAYLVLHQPDAVDSPPGAPDVRSSRVVYCGETHGRTTSLWSRLRQFGRSAGLFGERRDGHYAAWGFGKPDGCAYAAEDVWVGLFPVPETVREDGDQHGAWPQLAEAELLWTYVQWHPSHRLPPLNNRGSQDSSGDLARLKWQTAMPLEDVKVLVTGQPKEKRRKAAEKVLSTIAENVWGYSDNKHIRFREGDDGGYAFRHLGGRLWLYVGWTAERGAYVSLWSDDVCEFGEAKGEGPVDTVERFDALVVAML